MTEPVKVVLERHARRGREEALHIWAQRFVEAAARQRGHEGNSVFAGHGGSHTILLRFADRAALEQWEGSDEYRALLLDADVVSTPGAVTQHRSGLETWFALADARAPSPPARWKMALLTWLALLPMVLILGRLLAPLALPTLLNAAISTAIPVATLTWIVMPRLARLLAHWLYPSTQEK